MSKEYEGQDLGEIAAQAERDMNASSKKQGETTHSSGVSDSTNESGVNQAAANKFAGGEVDYGSSASGAGDNRDIPLHEGGSVNPKTGQLYKAGDFEGPGGPEDQARIQAENNPGSDDVRDNIRMQK